MCELLLVIKVDKTLFFPQDLILRVFNPILSEREDWMRVSFSVFALSRYPEVGIFQL